MLPHATLHMATESSRLDVLSSIKGILILIIALFHAKGFFKIEYIPGIRYAVNHAHEYANYFFFTISGFLIAVGYRERISEGKIDLLHFMLKRLQKIYPLYIVTNFIVLLITVLQGSFIETANLLYLVRVALMMSYGWFGNVQPFNYPTWFLCILMQCYLIFFFVAKTREKKPNLYVLLLALIPISGYFIMNNDFNVPFLTQANGEAYLSFFVGVILRELFLSFEASEKNTREKLQKRIFVYCFGVILICVAGATIYSFKVFTGNPIAINVILVCPAILFLAVYFKPFNSFLNLKPFRFLGEISMSIYFWHAPLLFTFKFIRDTFPVLRNFSEGIRSSVFFLVLLAFSAFSHYYLEKRVFS